MPNKPTSRQVAERAGVSQTTVSFVLNNVEGANISAETRERVLQAARELRYVPDTAARALARGRSDNIALVLGRAHRQVFIDEYIPSVLTGIHEAIQPNGFRVMVEMVTDVDNPATYSNLIRGKEVAGMIVNLNATMLRDVEEILAHTAEHFPIVTLDEVHPDVFSVTVAKLDGTRRIVEHLISLGHQRIACITYGPLTDVHPANRLAIYRDVLGKAHLPYDESLVRVGGYDPDTGYQAMQSLLASGAQFTALYAMNDVMAFGAMRAIHEAGLRIPDDIAVVGFDDIRLAQFSTPPLTTMREPDIEHGRLAAQMVLDLINGITPAARHIRLETELIVRESCGANRRDLNRSNPE
jgi:LacI family transcriptional regulator